MLSSPLHNRIESPAAEMMVDDLVQAATALIAVLLTEPSRANRLRGSARRVARLAAQLHELAELLAREEQGGRAATGQRTARPSV